MNLSTRESPTFGYIRRKVCGNEHKFTTQEVVISEEDLKEERHRHLKRNLAALQAKWDKTRERDVKIRAEFAKGKPRAELAREFHVSIHTIRRATKKDKL